MRITDLALAPWAIRPEAGQLLYDIARRQVSDLDAASRRLAKRQQEIEGIAVTPGKRLDGASAARVRGNVAILPVEGPIFRYANLFASISGATSIEMLTRDFNLALRDPDVKAILLHVDSPGGEVSGTGEFADMIYNAREQKPIWAYVSYEGASAAYWIASACDRIVCAPTSLLGSIGVVCGVPDPDKRNDGSIEFVSSQSPNKRPNPTTKDGRAQIQTMVDDLADQFVGAVARNRGVTDKTVLEEFGAGAVMVGQKCVDAGLADAVGSFEMTLAEMDHASESKRSSARSSARASAAASTTVVDEHVDVDDTESKTPGAQAAEHSHKGALMKFSDLRALLSSRAGASEDEDFEVQIDDDGQNDREERTMTRPAATNAGASSADIELARLREENMRLVQSNRKLQSERIEERAQTFADRVIEQDRHAYPSEQNAIVATYVQMATDDSTYGPIQLENGKTMLRTDMLATLFAARPSHDLDEEALRTGIRTVQMLTNSMKTATSSATPDGQPVSDERREALLAKTDIGRQVLAARNGTGRSN